MRTQVAIVGAGPAGLVLSHLLHLQGIESVVLDRRSRQDIEETVRAGVLEQGTVDLLVETGLGDRLKAQGAEHGGIHLRFGGETHRIDFQALTGRSVTVYAQHEVLKDLIAARLAAGGTIAFGVDDSWVEDVTTDRPRVRYLVDGVEHVVEADVVAACEGSQTRSRSLIPEGEVRRDYFRQYPFAWFGILAEAPPSSEELIYAHSERGFALVSTRSPTVQRMYFQCHPTEQVDGWFDDRIWAELTARVGGELNTGPIFSKAVLQFRSFVCEPMQHGRMFLAGDTAHTVPPTGAKGMNLAIADVHVLTGALTAFYRSGRTDLLDAYTATALDRVWRAQHFSYWMTSMLHRFPDATDFDLRRQTAELRTVTGSEAGSRLLAENYVGLPLP
ncbi:MAG: 4-hydroxybenzoate 3-monooxygenase [Actinomycetota bacterium]|nr:4-hydroxybenzoate 3-monooxygenase [Actinomycetota bacterium]